MTGIDLSQKIQEAQAVDSKSSDRGFWMALGFFLLLLLIWGGLRVGIAFIDNQIKDTLARTKDARDRMAGDDVNRIADFYLRSEITRKALAMGAYPLEQFEMLERGILPQVRVTSYDYEAETGRVEVRAVTPEFRRVAEQLAKFKEQSLVSSVSARGATRATGQSNVAGAAGEGEVDFLFSLTLRKGGSSQ